MKSKLIQKKDEKPTSMTVTLPAHIVQSLKTMETNTTMSVDELVSIALKFYIATHNDYLGLRPK